MSNLQILMSFNIPIFETESPIYGNLSPIFETIGTKKWVCQNHRYGKNKHKLWENM